MSQDDSSSVLKVSIPKLDIDVEYQNWRISIESALMTRGLIRYIQAPLPADASVADVDKRTQAFGIICSYLSFSERLAIGTILASGSLDAHALWTNIKTRHEKVDISRVWAHWRRLNAPPTAAITDRTAIHNWFSDTVAAYNAYMTSGRQIDEYTACMIMLDNLPEMWDSMRRSITQAGNSDNVMTFAVLRGNMETELITRKSQQQTTDSSQALLMMGSRHQQQSGQQRPPKRPRLKFQRTQGATCSKCNKPNHTAQQCGRTMDDPAQQADGSLQLAAAAPSSSSRQITLRGQRTNQTDYGDGYDSDELEIHGH